MNEPTLRNLPDDKLAEVEERLRDVVVGGEFGKPLWDALTALRAEACRELRRRGVESDAVRLVLDHGGHQVWTIDDSATHSRGGWHAQCDCGWAADNLPSIGAADQECEAHVAKTGGRWDRDMMNA